MKIHIGYRTSEVVSYLEEIFGPSGLSVELVGLPPDIDVQIVHPLWTRDGHIDLGETMEQALVQYGATKVQVCPVPGQPEVCGGIFLDGREPAFVIMAGENPPGWDPLVNIAVR